VGAVPVCCFAGAVQFCFGFQDLALAACINLRQQTMAGNDEWTRNAHG
jgi:hypothetical protein